MAIKQTDTLPRNRRKRGTRGGAGASLDPIEARRAPAARAGGAAGALHAASVQREGALWPPFIFPGGCLCSNGVHAGRYLDRTEDIESDALIHQGDPSHW